MSGPLDPTDAFWAQARQDPNFIRAWNAALWETRKMIDDPLLTRRDIIQALDRMTIRGPA